MKHASLTVLGCAFSLKLLMYSHVTPSYSNSKSSSFTSPHLKQSRFWATHMWGRKGTHSNVFSLHCWLSRHWESRVQLPRIFKMPSLSTEYTWPSRSYDSAPTSTSTYATVCWFVVHIDRRDMFRVVEQSERATQAHSFLILKEFSVVFVNLLFNLLNIISDSW
jgi:hypothetical protein